MEFILSLIIKVKKFVIGATTLKEGALFLERTDLLLGIYLHAKKYCPYTLPAFSQAKIYTGLRHLGYKRMPFWGKVGEKTFAVHSLYKNGLSLSFLAANDLINQCFSHLYTENSALPMQE